jgi:hypothetical protein
MDRLQHDLIVNDDSFTSPDEFHFESEVKSLFSQIPFHLVVPIQNLHFPFFFHLHTVIQMKVNSVPVGTAKSSVGENNSKII